MPPQPKNRLAKCLAKGANRAYKGGVPQDLCYKAAMDRVAGSIAAANESMKYDYKEGKRK